MHTLNFDEIDPWLCVKKLESEEHAFKMEILLQSLSKKFLNEANHQSYNTQSIVKYRKMTLRNLTVWLSEKYWHVLQTD